MSNEAFAFALMHSIYGKKKKANTKAKKAYNNWFEKLQVDELKSLCRASRLPVSGTKAALCERLCLGEFSTAYAYEYAPEKFSRERFEYEMSSGYGSGGDNYGNRAAAPRPAQQGSKRASGLSNEQLKTMCREKKLIISGKRYDLVLRLLQNQTGAGGAPKRAAVTIDEEGNSQPKKRAKSMKLPDVEKIKERTFKKFFPPDEVTFKWSNNKHKYHPTDCIKFANNIIEKEVFEKELFQRGEEKLAWELINVFLYRITVGNVERRQEWAAEQRAKSGGLFMMIGGTDVCLGRCSYEIKSEFLPKIVKAIRATSSKSVLEELSGKTLWDFQTQKLRESSEFDEVYTGTDTGDYTKRESFKEILNEHIPCKMESAAMAGSGAKYVMYRPN
mmetsp:Transcript_20609/g.44770  ORF Transcript_20609/g.44770 Transcript_20609/m.44770 type:complete len:388 (-) Transcript_20609:60-1223(-)|eukprot:CAMPEP_0172308492 /NCGR_PEP_ID=MMETSP1058-20130122/9070_1 /TAXON_ID=83371 /ORGANISM="Detonula confervacea, Strain CCMP 353" /LENGTH=387 /DNA_ID=CAMNT_0013020921 /DNA_START=96 /DNA_END=1259 /DNA_ORIENTATION=-